jgi:hypothetical protein
MKPKMINIKVGCTYNPFSDNGAYYNKDPTIKGIQNHP